MRLQRWTTPRDSHGSWVSTGSVVVFVTSLGLVLGAVVYLVAPFGRLDHPEPRPSNEQIASSRDSLDSASMMFGLMNSALMSASGSIRTITASAEDIFNAVDTATEASATVARAMAEAPSTGAAAGGANESLSAISSALVQVRGLAGAAGQLDSFVTPLISILEASNTPASNRALAQLRQLQQASRQVTSQLGSLSNLDAQISRVKGSLTSASSQVDTALGQARNAANQLAAGFKKMSTARTDTVAGARKITDGVAKLSGVMTTINNNLESAKTNLAAPAQEDADNAGAAPTGPADRLPWAILIGAAAIVLTLAAIALAALRARSMRNRPESMPSTATADTDTRADANTTRPVDSDTTAPE